MKHVTFRVLKSGDKFFAKLSSGKIHEFMVLERTVQVYLSESPANVVDLKTGKFVFIKDTPQTKVYPKSMAKNKKPDAENMCTTEASIWE